MMDLISDFDKRAGLEPKYDRGIRDPYFTVYGSSGNPRYDREKLASGIYVDELKTACARPEFISKMASAFGQEFANELKADPVAIFNSMPAPERAVITESLKG